MKIKQNYCNITVDEPGSFFFGQRKIRRHTGMTNIKLGDWDLDKKRTEDWAKCGLRNES